MKTIFALACAATSCAIGMTPARAGSLDNCGTWGHFQTSPHCMDQVEFCDAYGTEAMNIAFYSTVYSDRRDIAAMLGGSQGNPQVLPEGVLERVIDNIIPYREKAGLSTKPPPRSPEDNAASNAFWKRVATDCIGGTGDFIDNDGP
jgi:hypothetical protein